MAQTTRRGAGHGLALIGIAVCALLFGFFTVAQASELGRPSADLGDAAGFVLVLGSAVTAFWIVLAAAVKRAEFTWGGDAFLAVVALEVALAIAVVLGTISTLVDNAADETALVEIQIGRSDASTISVPAWATVPLALLALAFIASLVWVSIVGSATPGRGGHRMPRRAQRAAHPSGAAMPTLDEPGSRAPRRERDEPPADA